MSLHPAHALATFVVDHLHLMRESLVARWDGYVTVEQHEWLHGPEKASIEVGVSRKLDASKPEELFTPTYRVSVRYDAGEWRAELIVEWINGRAQLGEVCHRSGPDQTDTQTAMLVAATVVGWLLLGDDKLEELEQRATERMDREDAEHPDEFGVR